MKLGTLVEGFTPKGGLCCNDPAHSSEHGAELWDRDLSGRCSGDKHEQCAHSAGGPQEHGLPITSNITGEAHTWRCGCDCHPEQQYKPWRDKWLAAAHRDRLAQQARADDVPVQLDLFGAVA